MKSPRSASSRALLVVGLEHVGRDRQDVAVGDALRQRGDEGVVDEHDPVDLLRGVELGRHDARSPARPRRPGRRRSRRRRRSRLARGRSASSGPSCRPRASAPSCPRPRERRSSANERRRTWPLNAPARPRSPVSGTISTVSIVSRCCRSGRLRTDDAARPTPAISSLIVSAYGRIASIRAWARRSFAAATSSSARVILRVLRDGLDPPLEILNRRHVLAGEPLLLR